MISRFFTAARTVYYSLLFKVPIKNIRIYGPVSVICPDRFRFGSGLRLNHYCYINASGFIYAGNNVTVSAGAKLLTAGIKKELFLATDRASNYHDYSSIRLGENVWIGSGAIVMPGVNLGNNVIVAAGAVVTTSFSESNVVLGGIPARILRFI